MMIKLTWRTANPRPMVIAIRRPPNPSAKFLMKISIKALALFLIWAGMGRTRSSDPARFMECFMLPSPNLIRMADQRAGWTRMTIAPKNSPTGRKRRETATPKYFMILPVRNNWRPKEAKLKVDNQKPKKAVSRSASVMVLEATAWNW